VPTKGQNSNSSAMNFNFPYRNDEIDPSRNTTFYNANTPNLDFAVT